LLGSSSLVYVSFILYEKGKNSLETMAGVSMSVWLTIF
jgi:hypothetical protein